jgi:hypothetical protein
MTRRGLPSIFFTFGLECCERFVDWNGVRFVDWNGVRFRLEWCEICGLDLVFE